MPAAAGGLPRPWAFGGSAHGESSKLASAETRGRCNADCGGRSRVRVFRTGAATGDTPSLHCRHAGVVLWYHARIRAHQAVHYRQIRSAFGGLQERAQGGAGAVTQAIDPGGETWSCYCPSGILNRTAMTRRFSSPYGLALGSFRTCGAARSPRTAPSARRSAWRRNHRAPRAGYRWDEVFLRSRRRANRTRRTRRNSARAIRSHCS